MGPFGVQEMIFIFVLALLILGPKKLPELGRSIGKGMSEFRRASNELRNTFEREMHNVERETEPLKQAARDISATSYDYPYDDYNESPDPTASVSAAPAAESQPAPTGEASQPTS